MKLNYIGKILMLEDENSNEKVLAIGDLHLGYEESLRRSGISLPINLYERVMEDFEKIFNYLNEKEINKFNKIVVLGDLKHEFGKVLREEWDYIGKVLVWLKKRCNELIVIEGNHDKILMPILKNVNIVGEDYYIWKDVCFLHGDKDFEAIENSEIKFLVMGHGHPAIKIKDNEGIKVENYKCFLVGKYKNKNIIIVPSFFPLIEGSDIRYFDLGFAWDFNFNNFEVKVVNENLEVFDFGKLKYIS